MTNHPDKQSNEAKREDTTLNPGNVSQGESAQSRYQSGLNNASQISSRKRNTEKDSNTDAKGTDREPNKDRGNIADPNAAKGSDSDGDSTG